MMTVVLVLGTTGYFGLAVSLQNELSWVVSMTFMCFGFVGFGFLNIAIFGYITDCFSKHTAEAFVCINLTSLYVFG